MKRRKGFTLIELLVVIAIIALLVSILLPSVNRARELAKRAVCKTRLKGLGTAFELFSQAEGGWPYNYVEDEVSPNTGNNLVLLVHEGYASGKNFVCPSTSDKNLEAIEDDDDDSIVHAGYLDSDGDKATGYRASYGFQASQGDGDDYTGTSITDSTHGAVAVMADKGIDELGNDFDWSADDLTEDDIEANNSQNHSGDMQNVLFKAGHVSEEDRADCGYEDNSGDGPDAIFEWDGGTDEDNEDGPSSAGAAYEAGNEIVNGDSVLIHNDLNDD